MPTPHALFPADFDVAYTYYFPILFRFAVKHLNGSEIAKDLAQETLIQFWKINGLSIFTDFEYIPLKTKLSPTVNLRIGYNHIWNQYENGTGEVLFEFGSGINYKMTEKLILYLQSGILTMQQSSFITVRIGIKLWTKYNLNKIITTKYQQWL